MHNELIGKRKLRAKISTEAVTHRAAGQDGGRSLVQVNAIARRGVIEARAETVQELGLKLACLRRWIGADAPQDVRELARSCLGDAKRLAR